MIARTWFLWILAQWHRDDHFASHSCWKERRSASIFTISPLTFNGIVRQWTPPAKMEHSFPHPSAHPRETMWQQRSRKNKRRFSPYMHRILPSFFDNHSSLSYSFVCNDDLFLNLQFNFDFESDLKNENDFKNDLIFSTFELWTCWLSRAYRVTPIDQWKRPYGNYWQPSSVGCELWTERAKHSFFVENS